MEDVWIKQCGGYNLDKLVPLVEEVLEKYGLPQIIKPGARVVLKPNLLSARDPAQGVTTHPVLLEAVVLSLQNLGAKVTLFDSPGGPFTGWMLGSVYDATGLTDLAHRTGAALNWDTAIVTISNPEGKLVKRVEVARAVTGADFIINIPKLKNHGLTILTGAVKNMFGCIPGLKKVEYHFRFPEAENFCDALIDIAISLPAVLVLMDAIIVMEGAGPSAGRLRQGGFLLAGADPFAVDLLAAKLVGLEAEDIPPLKAAKARGLLPEWAHMEINGPPLEDLTLPRWELPPSARKPNVFGGRIPERYRDMITKHLRPEPLVMADACRGCMDCLKSCPAKCIRMENKKARIDTAKCLRCFCCQEFCAHHAVKIKRPLLARLLFKL
ncbi:MAG: DUF362 domain-containing protein [Bacillota bacterium]